MKAAMNFINGRRLKKELRLLLLPWSLSVLAGGLVGLRPWVEGSGLEGLLLTLAGNGFLGGLALLATTAFGSELHERTLTLLLTQPRERTHFWAEKMLAIVIGILTAVLAEILLLSVFSRSDHGDQIVQSVHDFLSYYGLLSVGVFLWVSVCSCAFWTLVAGSSIGGVVFTVAGQFLTLLAVDFAVSKMYGQDQLFQDARAFPAVAAGELLYSLVLLYLGWKKFVKLEVRTTSFGQGTTAFDLINWEPPWSRFLISRPAGRLLNLARKELRLQKPMFQLAGIFVLCWVMVVIVQLLRPSQNIANLLDVLTCLYAPITCLLVACISLGEEKALGITAAQLVLPFPYWLQWLLKLAVGTVVAAVLSLGLPMLLFVVTGDLLPPSPRGLMIHQEDAIPALAMVSGLMFLLGYWAASLTTSTVRAAIVAIAAVIILPTCAALGIQWAHIALAGLHQGSATQQADALVAAAVVGAVCVLGQSLLRFRKSEERAPKLLFYSIILVALVLLVSFSTTCFG